MHSRTETCPWEALAERDKPLSGSQPRGSAFNTAREKGSLRDP